MSSRRLKLRIWILTMFITALACSVEADEPETLVPISLSPTVNLTLTSVFSGIDDGEATAPAVATSTEEVVGDPTEVLIQPSATSIIPTLSGLITNTPLATRPFLAPPDSPTLTPNPVGGPTTHSGPSVVALYVSPSPIIDGDFSDWAGITYPISNVVFGSGYYLDSNDVSGLFQVGWDATHLYIGVEVADNKFVQVSSGKYLYLGDSIEILIDADVSGDFTDDSLSFDDHQLGISPGSPLTGKLPEAYIWYPVSKRGPSTVVEMAVILTSNGYKIEMAIPLSLFGIFAAQDQHFGFAISISDNDTAGSQWQQSMVSNVATRRLTDPTTWGDLVFSVP